MTTQSNLLARDDVINVHIENNMKPTEMYLTREILVLTKSIVYTSSVG